MRMIRSLIAVASLRVLGVGALALGVLLCLCAPAARASTARPESAPPWRVGGRVGFTLDAIALPESTGYVLEVFLRIPPATLAQLARDESGNARLRSTVRVKGRFGARVAESNQEFVLMAADSALGQGKVLLARFPAAPGPCQIEARLEDQLSRRKGLVLSSKNRTESVGLVGQVELPRPQAGRDLSDIEFVWPTGDDRAGLAFVRAGRALVPNPERLYGLYAANLEASFTARSKPGDERAWKWVARVFDSGGHPIAEHESTGVAGRFLEAQARFDLSDVPAGGYDLEVKAWQEGDAGALVRRARFSMGWKPETWLRNAADVTDDAHFMLESEDEQAFIEMQPGEQERVLEDYWRVRDPSPETARNEALDLFRQRVAYANETFTRHAIEKGMFSDMGRTYIRFGPPTEVLHQVMPAGDETLLQALQQVIVQEDREVSGGINQKGLGGDIRPYEVWVYEGDIPLPLDADPRDTNRHRSRRRLLFLFVDEQGMGTFTLRHSTE